MNKRHLQATFVKQLDQSDCGVACLRSVMRYYGGEKSLETLREFCGTSKYSTTLLGLYHGAQKCGFNAVGHESDMDSLKKIKDPIVLHVLINNSLQHYVLCYAFEKGKFIIGDPAIGIVEMTEEEVEKYGNQSIV